MSEHRMHPCFGEANDLFWEHRFIWEGTPEASSPEPSDDESLKDLTPKDTKFMEKALRGANKEIMEDGIRDSGPYFIDVKNHSTALRDFIIQKLHDGEVQRADILDLRDMVQEALEDDLDDGAYKKLIKEFPLDENGIIELWIKAGIITPIEYGSAKAAAAAARGAGAEREDEEGREEEGARGASRTTRRNLDIPDLHGWKPIVEAMAEKPNYYITQLHRLNRVLRERNPDRSFIEQLDGTISQHAIRSGVPEDHVNMVRPRNYDETREFSHYALTYLKGASESDIASEFGIDATSPAEISEEEHIRIESRLRELHAQIVEISQRIRQNATREFRAGLNMQRQQLLREYTVLNNAWVAAGNTSMTELMRGTRTIRRPDGEDEIVRTGAFGGRSDVAMEREGMIEDKERREELARQEAAKQFLRDAHQFGPDWVRRQGEFGRTDAAMGWAPGTTEKLNRSMGRLSETARIALGAQAEELEREGSIEIDSTLHVPPEESGRLTPERRAELEAERRARAAAAWLGFSPEEAAARSRSGRYERLRDSYIPELEEFVNDAFDHDEAFRSDPAYPALRRAYVRAVARWRENPGRTYFDLAFMQSQIEYILHRSGVNAAFEDMRKSSEFRRTERMSESGGFGPENSIRITIPADLLPDSDEPVTVTYTPFLVIGCENDVHLQALMDAGIFVERHTSALLTPYRHGGVRPRVRSVDIHFSRPGTYRINGAPVIVEGVGERPNAEPERLESVAMRGDVDFGRHTPRQIIITDDRGESSVIYLGDLKRSDRRVDESESFAVLFPESARKGIYQVEFARRGTYKVVGFESSGNVAFSYTVRPDGSRSGFSFERASGGILGGLRRPPEGPGVPRVSEGPRALSSFDREGLSPEAFLDRARETLSTPDAYYRYEEIFMDPRNPRYFDSSMPENVVLTLREHGREITGIAEKEEALERYYGITIETENPPDDMKVSSERFTIRSINLKLDALRERFGRYPIELVQNFRCPPIYLRDDWQLLHEEEGKPDRWLAAGGVHNRGSYIGIDSVTHSFDHEFHHAGDQEFGGMNDDNPAWLKGTYGSDAVAENVYGEAGGMAALARRAEAEEKGEKLPPPTRPEGFAREYGMEGGIDEDQATIAETLLRSPKSYRVIMGWAAREPALARKIEMMKLFYERASGGLMDERFWSDFARGVTINPDYWAQRRTERGESGTRGAPPETPPPGGRSEEGETEPPSGESPEEDEKTQEEHIQRSSAIFDAIGTSLNVREWSPMIPETLHNGWLFLKIGKVYHEIRKEEGGCIDENAEIFYRYEKNNLYLRADKAVTFSLIYQMTDEKNLFGKKIAESNEITVINPDNPEITDEKHEEHMKKIFAALRGNLVVGQEVAFPAPLEEGAIYIQDHQFKSGEHTLNIADPFDVEPGEDVQEHMITYIYNNDIIRLTPQFHGEVTISYQKGDSSFGPVLEHRDFTIMPGGAELKGGDEDISEEPPVSEDSGDAPEKGETEGPPPGEERVGPGIPESVLEQREAAEWAARTNSQHHIASTIGLNFDNFDKWSEEKGADDLNDFERYGAEMLKQYKESFVDDDTDDILPHLPHQPKPNKEQCRE